MAAAAYLGQGFLIGGDHVPAVAAIEDPRAESASVASSPTWPANWPMVNRCLDAAVLRRIRPLMGRAIYVASKDSYENQTWFSVSTEETFDPVCDLHVTNAELINNPTQAPPPSSPKDFTARTAEDGESPVTGDCHAGICKSRRVKLPPTTRSCPLCRLHQ